MRDTILNYISRSSYRPMRVRELAREMQIPEAEYHAFRQMVKELEDEGQIIRLKGNRYGPPDKLNLIVGRLNVNPAGYGFVCRETGPDIYVDATSIGIALHGDKVVVRLHGHRGPKGAPEGRVIRILERALTVVVGTYRRDKHFGYVEPDDRRIIRDIYIPDNEAKGAKEGQKVVTVIEEWSSEHLNPEGRIDEILGYPDDPGMDVLAIIKEYDLPVAFPPAVEAEAQTITREIPHEEIQRRRDLRGEICVTIDPEDAKDFDDAVSLEWRPNGHAWLGVHIADVSYYAREGSLLDQEARSRGTSVYLVDRVIPMLPERLSNDLCSLKPGEDRLTMTVFAEITAAGDVVSYEIAESVIRSRARLTYQEVQALLDGSDEGRASGFRETLIGMEQIRRDLTGKRIRRGAIDLDIPEAKVTLDGRGRPVDVRRYPRLDSHRLVEEFMLLTNEIVASHLEGRGIPTLYRIHDQPDPLKLKDFADFVTSLGYRFKPREQVDPLEIQRLLTQITGKKEEGLINELLLRSMKRAMYSPANIGHFGLACPTYTHFTSPIRRYPDLLVHRVLRQQLQGMMSSVVKERLIAHLPHVGELTSERERIAQEAERDSVEVKQVQFLEDKLGEEYDGIISGVQAYGFFVTLEDTLIEGLVKVSWLEDDYYIFDDKRYCLIGRHTKRTFRLGDRVRVRVVRADPGRRQVDFLLVENGKGAKQKGKRQKGERAKRQRN